jgi:Na+/H+ antiporter NhaD/arsenite permease-like protein
MLMAVTFLRRLHPLDWLAGALLVLGLLAVATGLLPSGPAADVLARVGPLLVFLATVIVLAELTGKAEVFDVVATWVARAGKGSYVLLFGLCVVFASVTTITLNLDTTAVLLTPVMLALATRVGIAAVPLAMTTVWLANTASLLLPVSNLTNLLAADRVALSPSGMAAVMWPPQVAAIAATMVCLWVFYWRRGARGEDRYLPPEPPRPADPVLLRVCAVVCGGFLLVLLADLVPLWVASTGAALVVARCSPGAAARSCGGRWCRGGCWCWCRGCSWWWRRPARWAWTGCWRPRSGRRRARWGCCARRRSGRGSPTRSTTSRRTWPVRRWCRRPTTSSSWGC